MTAIEKATGRIEWRRPLGTDRGLHTQIRGQIAAADGRVFLTTGEGALALDGGTGKAVWARPESGFVFRGDVVADRSVVVLTTNDEITGRDPRTGIERWRRRVPDSIDGRTVLHAGMVYARSKNSFVYALRARDGRIAWSRRFEKPLSDPMAADGRAIYVGSGASVVALDRQTGAILWQAPLRWSGVTELAADGRRVYVAHQGGLETLTTEGVSIGCLALDGRVVTAGEAVYVIHGIRVFRLREFNATPRLLKRLQDARITNGAGCAAPRYDRSAIRDARTIKAGA